jgi:uncharacterized protein involved in exopolysaccharide biosynthesis
MQVADRGAGMAEDPVLQSAETGDATENVSILGSVPPSALLGAVWVRRWALLGIFMAGGVLAYAGSFLVTRKYTSSVLLMPPDAQTLSTTSALAGLNGQVLPTSLGGGGLFSNRTPGSTVIGILGSRTIRDHIIKRFQLGAVYHGRYPEDIRNTLADHTDLAEDRKSGLMSIAVTDTDRYRARDIAAAYVSELNRALTEVNTSSAHGERVFLEERLKSVKADEDSLAQQLSQFSSKTGTLNPQGQGQALFDAAAKMQAELAVAEAELSSLRVAYSPDNVRVKAAKARVDALTGQIAKLSGAANDNDGHFGAAQGLPNIRELPVVGLTYAELSQNLQVQQTIYQTLTRLYEVARVEEAKEIPSVKVLDAANVPDKPSSPKRGMDAVFCAFLMLFFALVYIVGSALWRLAPETALFKSGIRAIRCSARV